MNFWPFKNNKETVWVYWHEYDKVWSCHLNKPRMQYWVDERYKFPTAKAAVVFINANVAQGKGKVKFQVYEV